MLNWSSQHLEAVQKYEATFGTSDIPDSVLFKACLGYGWQIGAIIPACFTLGHTYGLLKHSILLGNEGWKAVTGFGQKPNESNTPNPQSPQ